MSEGKSDWKPGNVTKAYRDHYDKTFKKGEDKDVRGNNTKCTDGLCEEAEGN